MAPIEVRGGVWMSRTDQKKVNPEMLVEMIPFLRRYHKKVILIKYGGNAMVNDELKKQVIEDIVLMKYMGMYPVVIHGGGPEITSMLELIGKKSTFVEGLRVTDKETMTVSEMVLSGKIAKDLVARISSYGIKSIGLSGQDGGLIVAEQKNPELGYVGEIKKINSELINKLLNEDFIPVISSIGCDENGNRYNINADEAAGKIAIELNAPVQIMLTNIQGVMKSQGDEMKVIPRINVKEIDVYIKDGVITGGMIPKVKGCAESVMKGVEKVYIIDGRKSHSLLSEIFSDLHEGTVIHK